ncbi:unnamed protein product, partial [Musa hybrid cultivar]
WLRSLLVLLGQPMESRGFSRPITEFVRLRIRSSPCHTEDVAQLPSLGHGGFGSRGREIPSPPGASPIISSNPRTNVDSHHFQSFVDLGDRLLNYLFDFDSALSSEMKSTIDTVVQSHKVALFMKGAKDFPQCGFSSTVVPILKSLNEPLETPNVPENEMLRQGMKEYPSWLTFLQLFVEMLRR